MEKSISQMTKEIVQDFAEYDKTGTAHWNYEIAAKDLMYQVGSLMKLVMQIEGERYADGKSKEEITRGISDEISDILADTLFIAHELGISVPEAWENMKKSDAHKISTRSKA